MTPRQRFAKLVEGAFDPSLGQKPNLSADQCLLDAEGRSFHLDLNAERGEIAASTLVFFNDRDPGQIHADLIADFNAYHLFHGGYRLSVDPHTLSLYVSVTRSLDGLEQTGLAPFFNDFVERCMTCTRWYMDECSRRFALSLGSEAALAL